MEILAEFNRITGLNCKYSRSFKTKKDSSFEDRPLYRIYCNNSELEILLSLIENNQIYNHIRNRYENTFLTFVAIRDNYLKISVCPLVFKIGDVVCYGVELDNKILTESTYDCIPFDKRNLKCNSFVRRYIKEDYSVLRRHDGQHYFLISACTPKRILARIFPDNSEYISWLSDQNGTPFWYQKCENSEAIYFKDDNLLLF